MELRVRCVQNKEVFNDEGEVVYHSEFIGENRPRGALQIVLMETPKFIIGQWYIVSMSVEREMENA